MSTAPTAGRNVHKKEEDGYFIPVSILKKESPE
jgi:hypothetical protein